MSLPQGTQRAQIKEVNNWSFKICHLKLVISETTNDKLQICNDKFQPFFVRRLSLS
jgi:hypothetical protein